MSIPHCLRTWLGWSLILFAAFGSTLFFTYGYNDDYHFITRANDGRLLPLHNEIWEDGRPLMSLLFSGAYRLIGSVEELALLRAICLLLVLATVGSLSQVLRRGGFPAQFAFWAASAACLTPPFGVLVGWAGGGLHNLAGNLLAIWAAILFHQQTQATETNWYRVWLIPPLMLLGALFFYQVSGAFFLVALALMQWQTPLNRQHCNQFISANLIFAFCAIAYYVIVRLVLVDVEGRLAIGFEISDRVRLLFNGILQPSLLGWFYFLKPNLQLLAGAGVFFLILAGIAGGACKFPATDNQASRPAQSFVRTLWILSAIGAATGPLLLSKYIYPVYRSQTGLHVLVTVIAAWGLWHLTPARFKRISPALVAVVFAGICGWQVWSGIVKPNADEYRSVHTIVADQFDRVPDRVVYRIPPFQYDHPRQNPIVFEYRQISSAHKQVTLGFLQCIFRDLFLVPGMPADERAAVAEKISSLEIYSQPVSELPMEEIDGLRAVAGEPEETIDHPFWGELKMFSNGWVRSAWFGDMDLAQYPSAFHHEFDWIFPQFRDESGGLFLHFQHLGNVYIHPESFPLVVRTADQNYLLASFEITKQSWYYNFTTETHEFIRFHYHQTD